MATGKVSKRSIDALTKTGNTEYFWDDQLAGFGVRMTANGALSYIYQYRMGGREATKKRCTIGKHGSPWTPKTARDEAERIALMVGQGIDPGLADRERRRQAVELAFEPYADSFVEAYLKTRWKDWKLGKSMLEREAVPVLKMMPLPAIRRTDIVSVLDRLADRPAVARLMHATLRKLFKWAASRGDIERSPLEGMDAPPIPIARDRVLSDEELSVVWASSKELGYPFGPLFRLLIATGQRREEVTGLDWCELDREQATWTLPGTRAKNGRVHIVALNALAIAELDDLARTSTIPHEDENKQLEWPRRGFLFTTTGKTAVSGHSRAKVRIDEKISSAIERSANAREEVNLQMPEWRVHDIRRTVATGLQRLGVRFEVTEAVLNHVSGARSGVAGVYQRHDWKDEKCAALNAWGDHVQTIISGPSRMNARSGGRSN